LMLFKSDRLASRYVWYMIAAYAASKLFEAIDVPVYEMGHLMSGHSIKHIVAALAPLILLYGLTRHPEKSPQSP
ncbi:MAG: ceramidase domain-containing protein, partial [Gammaproteobacteria bacterium]